MSYKLTVNHTIRVVDTSADIPLLYALRDELGLNGPRFGCGLGQCGACAVLIDGSPVRSCLLPISSLGGKSIITLEGLSEEHVLHPVQQAFIDEQAMQCGYCANGMIMATVSLLNDNPRPSRKDIVNALDTYICRCGTHTRIIKAVQRAAELMAGENS